MFTKSFQLNSRNQNHNQHETLVTLIDCLNDTAVSHSELLGYPLETLFKKGYAWILLFWNIEVIQLPRFGEKISIETWISQARRCYAFREFFIRNQRNRILVRASSQWVFYHIHRRRPVTIFLNLCTQWKMNPEQACQRLFMDPSFPEQPANPDRGKNFSVQQENIDILNHVHNSQYIDWILNIKSQTMLNQYRLKYLQVKYLHEIKYPGEILILQRQFSPGEQHLKTISEAIWDKTEKRIATKIVTQWQAAH